MTSTVKRGLPYFLALLLPILIMFMVLLTNGIWWGSDRTILASDGFHQYAIFAQSLRNILHGSDSLFYTFTSGLGLNFYALIGYYLGSFFSPFIYFFSLETIPDAIYLFTLMKFGCSGLTMFVTLRQLYRSVNTALNLALSTCYALMSFAVSQLEINTWLDVFIIAPIIMLGLHLLLEKRRFLVYYLSLVILFSQNYYFGFMMAIFLALYTLVQLTKTSIWRDRLKQFLDFAIVSSLSALSSAFMLLPSYLDLSTHGEQLSPITNWFSKEAWYLDVFAKHVVGAYDTTKFGSLPMISVGLFPLLLCLLFLTIKSISWQVRLAYGFLVMLMIAAFYLEPLDLLWQGMHAPNMFLHRYSWLLSLLIIIMAAETLSHWQSVTVKNTASLVILVVLGFSATAFCHDRYDFLTTSQIIMTILFVLAYLVILINHHNTSLPREFLPGVTLFFTVFEIFLNVFFLVNNLGAEWVFPTRESYDKDRRSIEALVTYSKSKETAFYRTERLLPQTGNDSMKFHYNGISQFSSIRNTASSRFLDRLGFQSHGTNLNLRYQNNTIIADSLLAVKYNLSPFEPQKFGFTKAKIAENLALYQNAYALPLGIMSKHRYKDVNFTANTLDNQSLFLNQLTGLSETYFQRLAYQTNTPTQTLSNRVSLEAKPSETAQISYQITVPARQQVYVSVPNLSLSDGQQKEVIVSYGQTKQIFTTDNTYSFFNIGYFEEAQTVTVELIFPGHRAVSFDVPHFYGLNILSYQKAMTDLKHQKTSTKTFQNTLLTTYQADANTSMIYTLPFDKGWKARVNGKPTKIRSVQKGIMAVDIPKGKGTIQLTFKPQGLKEGLVLSLLGLLLFLVYRYVIIIFR